MYRLEAKTDPHLSTLARFAQDRNLVLVKAGKLHSTNIPTNGLLLDFSVREHGDQKWAALEDYLREIFEEIVCVDLYPNCVIKLHIFLLNLHQHIESAVVNAVWLCLVKHGLPMKKSIWHYEWGTNCKAIIDINNLQNVLSSTAVGPLPPQLPSEAVKYKQFVKARLSTLLMS